MLVTLDTGRYGSGFFLNTEEASFFVTARHILVGGDPLTPLASTATLLSYPKVPREAGRNEFRLDLNRLHADGHLRWHPSKDIAVVRMATVVHGQKERETIAGVTILQLAPSGILGVAKANLKKLDEVLVANEVFVFGYPRSLGLQALPQLDLERPLLRRGVVAGVNSALQSIIVDCPVYPGNSGGPVLDVETEGLLRKFRVIGLVSEFVPFVETWVNKTHGWQNPTISNSGYSVVVPADFILDVLETKKTN